MSARATSNTYPVEATEKITEAVPGALRLFVRILHWMQVVGI